MKCSRLLALGWLLLATAGGCASLAKESQLFSRASRYQSADIRYVLEPNAAAAASGAIQPTSEPGKPPVPPPPQNRVTMAVRYPHPAGRSEYARVELIVESNPAAAQPARFAWLDRARRFANDNLPGVTMADGIEQALALDLPVAELDRLVKRLQQPLEPAEYSSGVGVLATATVNGAALPNRGARVAELDRLVTRVRREGSLITQRQLPSEIIPSATPGSTAVAATAGLSSSAPPTLGNVEGQISYQASGARRTQTVRPVNHTEPAPQRLPPVGP